MAELGKGTPVVLIGLIVLGGIVHVLVRGRVEAQIAAETAARGRTIEGLRNENRRLTDSGRREAAVTAPAATALKEGSTLRQMNEATDLLKSGLFGPVAWTRGTNTTIPEEIGLLADTLGLSAEKKAALIAAAEKGQREVAAAAMAGATVRLNDNAVPGPGETAEERAAFTQLMQTVGQLELLRMVAESQSKQVAARGLAELAIAFPESSAARAAFDSMQASFAEILGPDTYAFYQEAGASQMIEGMFDEIGLRPFALSIVRRPSGTISAGEESAMAARALMRENAIASGNAPPPEFKPSPAPATSSGYVYDFRRMRSLANGPDPVKRRDSGAGGNLSSGGNTAFAVLPQSRGISSGGPTSLSADALRQLMGPVGNLVPAGF